MTVKTSIDDGGHKGPQSARNTKFEPVGRTTQTNVQEAIEQVQGFVDDVTTDTQGANEIYAGPTTGADAAPTFRAMVNADLPDLAASDFAAQAANALLAGPTTGANAVPTFRAMVAADVPANLISNTKLAQMDQATFKMRAAAAGTGDPIDGTAAQAKTALGLSTSDSPQFTGIELGHATDTTLTRTGAGDIAVEGNAIYRAGGTDVPITDGGTGASTASAAFDALKQAATDSATGVVELATTTEAKTGTDTARAVTPAGLKAAMGWDFLGSATDTGVSQVSITSGFSSTYDVYVLKIVDFVPASDGTSMELRVGVSAAFLSGASDYKYFYNQITEGAVAAAGGDDAHTSIQLAGNVGNGTGEGACATVEILNANSALYKAINFHTSNLSSTTTGRATIGGGTVITTSAIDRIGVRAGTGNVTATIYLYGLRKS